MTTRWIDGLPVNNAPSEADMSDNDLRALLQSNLSEEMLQAGSPAGEQGTDDWAQWAAQQGPVMSALLHMRQFIQTRTPESMRQSGQDPLPPEAMAALENQRPVASGAGQMFFPMTTAMLAPGRVPAQAAVGGALEAIKEGSTWASTATQTGLAGLGQGVGNMATRVISGISRGAQALRGTGGPLTTESDVARIIAETGLGRGAIERINQGVLKGKLSKVFGIEHLGDDAFTATGQATARANNAKLYDEALEISEAVNTKEIRAILNDKDMVIPGKKRYLKMLGNVDDGRSLRIANTELRKLAASQKALPGGPELSRAVDILHKEAGEAGADMAKLGVANQKFKLLETMQEMPNFWQRGQIDTKALANRLGRENFKGFGKTVKEGREGLDEGVQSFIDDVLTLAADPRAVGRPGTAESIILGGGTIGGGTALAAGAIDPVTAGIGLVSAGVIPPIAGAASIGKPIAEVGKVLSGAATGLNQ